MTLKEFERLNEENQGIILFKDGEFLADIEFGNERRKVLYGVSNFYVEVVYNQEENVIEQFKPFSNLDMLEPYLAEIKLPDFIAL